MKTHLCGQGKQANVEAGRERRVAPRFCGEDFPTAPAHFEDKTMESSKHADDGDQCHSSVCHFGIKFGSSPEHDQITKANAT
jgi:hypothetical protein